MTGKWSETANANYNENKYFAVLYGKSAGCVCCVCVYLLLLGFAENEEFFFDEVYGILFFSG